MSAVTALCPDYSCGRQRLATYIASLLGGNIDGGIIHVPFAGAHGGADDYILESYYGYINGGAPEEYEGR